MESISISATSCGVGFRATDALGLASVNTVSVGVGGAGSGYQVAQSLHFAGLPGSYLAQMPAATRAKIRAAQLFS